jgi:ketosteroid isomerase-like protein
MDETFARNWYAAWNAGDLEAILNLYAEDLEASSPFIAALGFAAEGVIFGKAMFRAYLEAALPRVAGLRLEPVAMCVGARGHTMVYRNHTGVMVAETHELDADGLILRSDTAYETTPMGDR